MKAELITCKGRRYQLPAPLTYRFEYACGTPCDSFWLELPFSPGDEAIYQAATRFVATEENEVVFTGVVDEVEWGLTAKGSRVTLSGRSMAALLLDNEAEAADYAAATLEDLLRDHVAPYGIETARCDSVPACPGFSVASGQSEWQVVYEFVRYHGGISPRVDRKGRLVLTAFSDETVKVLGNSVPVTSLVCTEKRYGVLSEVLVRDKSRKTVERVQNEEFLAEGGACRRVLTVGGAGNGRAMRYSGQFQLQKSAAGRRRVTLTVPVRFYAWPGELLCMERAGCNGTWRVLESTVELGPGGGTTTLTLGPPDAVL